MFPFLQQRVVWSSILAVAGMSLIYSWSCLHFWPTTIDDSYITFRFARNLVEGHGLRFNPGGEAVEGFTNFLWMLISALFVAFRADVMQSMKIVGVLCGMGVIIIAWRFAAALRDKEDYWNLLPPALLAFNAHFAFWAVQGMETLMQVLLVLATYHFAFREMHDRRRWFISPVLAVLAVMTRLDSLWYFPPLAIYAGIMIARREIAWKRVLIMAAAGLVALVIYLGWKTIYFGDLLPNTYYAKIAGEELPKDRASAHLYQYYYNQAGWEDEQRPNRLHSIAWINVWMFGIGTCVLVLKRRVWLLILLPIALQACYIVRIAGDWMPGFRFFQVVLPFIAVAMPIALDYWTVLLRETRAKYAPHVFLLVCFIFSSVEQLNIETAYVFGRNPIWFERDEGWFWPSEISASLNKGFSPALGIVAEAVMLNTVDDGWILMSDVGLPMWYSRHLSLLDVDGLTNKVIADAPSARGNNYGAPSIMDADELYAKMVEQRGGTNNISPVAKDDLRLRAEEQYRERVLGRAARYVMDHHKPEYILAFEQHDDSNPQTPGYVYPPVARVATEHTRFALYEELWSGLKTSNSVYNHLYRRSDMPEAISASIQFERLLSAARENPRISELATALYLSMMENNTLKHESARNAVITIVSNTGANERVMHHMMYLASENKDSEMARIIHDSARRFTSADWLELFLDRADDSP